MILNAGLIVGTVTTTFSNTIAADNVIQQDPQAGEQVAVNSAVNYIISLGKPIVPNIFNKTAAEADANIVNAGLNIGPIITAYSNTITDEKVISQYPAAGRKAFVGSKVRYIKSLGKPTVPDVVGMTVRDARKAIANRKLKNSLTAEYSNTVAAGNIAGQNPIADTRALIGSKVIIVKSLGKPTVPRLVGKKAETANIAIVRAGLTVGTVTTVYNNAIAANRVISQDIAASTKIEIGSAVNYTMSLGKN
jgi:serine/threonine-protein kinase